MVGGEAAILESLGFDSSLLVHILPLFALPAPAGNVGFSPGDLSAFSLEPHITGTIKLPSGFLGTLFDNFDKPFGGATAPIKVLFFGISS